MPIIKGKPIWEGAITFGLVTIPIRLFSASKEKNIKLRHVHRADLAPIKQQAICAQGHRVSGQEIIRAYEYQPGRFVPVEEFELQDADLAHAQTVDIFEFVNPNQIQPIYYEKPYYTEPQKGADKVYALLRDSLVGMQRVGLARVKLKNRVHLAAVLPHAGMLIVEIMHYGDDFKRQRNFRVPSRAGYSASERRMAEEMIQKLSANFDPEKYTSGYKKRLLETIHTGLSEIKRQNKTASRQAKKQTKKLEYALRESLKVSVE